jgi:hypothetical protein
MQTQQATSMHSGARPEWNSLLIADCYRQVWTEPFAMIHERPGNKPRRSHWQTSKLDNNISITHYYRTGLGEVLTFTHRIDRVAFGI